jgi:hypothetical protein
MTINENFLVANIERFDKVAYLLAAKVSGCMEEKLIVFPVVWKKGPRLTHFAFRDEEC